MAEIKANPADATNIPTATERTRIPFSVPRTKLSVPEIPGYHLHWFNGTADRIMQAQQAGYEFVSQDEVSLENHELGSDMAKDGNTDLGTRVSHLAGSDIGHDGQPVRLYLMKIKEEWWQADQKALTAPGSRLDGVRQALVGGAIGASGQRSEDRAQTYLDPKRTKIPDFFTRKS